MPLSHDFHYLELFTPGVSIRPKWRNVAQNFARRKLFKTKIRNKNTEFFVCDYSVILPSFEGGVEGVLSILAIEPARSPEIISPLFIDKV